MAEIMRLADKGTGKAMPRKMGFTVDALTRATCPAGKGRTWLYDARQPGLAFMVTEKGAKAFYTYRKYQGRPQRVRLGGFPDISIEQARRLAAATLAKYADGIDPQAEKRKIRTSITLQELFDQYTKQRSDLRATQRTRETDKSRFDTCFADWTSRKLSSIKNDDVRAKHAAIGGARGKITANRAVQLLRRLYNWARIEPNPAAGKKAVDFFDESPRDRFLAADELPKFFAALDAELNQTAADYIRMSLWTGARRSNVQSMKWDEINLGTSTWRIPATKSKNGDPMDVHLSGPAIALLKAREDNDSDFVFPGHGKSGHLVEPKSIWKRILTAAGIKDLRLHDLRRTLGSWQAAAGTSLHVIGKSLGHQDVATTAIYARMDLEPVRASVNMAVAAIVAASKPKKAKGKAKGGTPKKPKPGG